LAGPRKGVVRLFRVFCNLPAKYYCSLPIYEQLNDSTALGLIDQVAGTGGADQVQVPLLEAHTSAISDFQFNPFNDDIIATVGHDRAMHIWRLDEISLRQDSAQAFRKSNLKISIKGSGRPSAIRFHPCAANLALVICGVLGDVGGASFKLYDIGGQKQEPALEVKRKANDFVFSAAWSFDGTSIAAVGASRKLECFDPRTNEAAVISEEETHHSYNKPVKVISLREFERCVTIGYSDDGLREVALWDLRNPKCEVSRTRFDREAGPSSFASLLDIESNFLFLSTRGERDVDVMQLEPESGHVFHIDTYRSLGLGTTQAIAMMPKSTCDFGSGEIARLARVSKNQIEQIRFKVVKGGVDSDVVKTMSSSGNLASSDQSLFQDRSFLSNGNLDVVSVASEIFPEILLPEPSLTAAEWVFLKQNGWPKTAPLSAGGKVAVHLSRLIGSAAFADCRIRLPDQSDIPAHRCILSCRSQVLRNMLLAAQSRGENELQIEASRTAIDAVLQFIYTDSIPSLRFAAAAKDILQLAQHLEISGMVARLFRQHPSLAEQTIAESRSDVTVSSYLRDMHELMKDGRSYFSDLDVCSASCIFPVHRALVAIRSPFFHKMLTSGFQEERDGRIVLQDLGESEIKAVVASLYTGRPGQYINADNVLEIWLIATQHDLIELSRACEMYIQESVDTDNVVPLFIRAELMQSSPALRKFLLNYMTSFWDIISANPESIADLDPQHIRLIQERRPVKAARLKLFGGN
jgi:WD40 repeat protein